MWIVVLAVAACIGAGCGGSPSTNNSTRASEYLHALEHHRSTASTTTTVAGRSTTSTTLASGPNDKAACTSLASIGSVAHSGHQAIATYFRRLFSQLHQAENPYIRGHGHSAAVALLLDKVGSLKKAFYDLYLECSRIGIT
jgi:hypothetical protein